MLNDQAGSILISILLGLGLAAVFRKACTGANCVVVRPPDMKEVNKYVYKLDESCYKYTPKPIPCPRGGATAAS